MCVHLHYMRVLSDGICIINCKYSRPGHSALRKQGFEHNSFSASLKGFVTDEIIRVRQGSVQHSCMIECISMGLSTNRALQE